MARYIGSYEEYASGFMDCLLKFEASNDVIKTMQVEHENIFQRRRYTAPEAVDQSQEKLQFFRAFVDHDKYHPTAGKLKEAINDYLHRNG